DQLAEEVGRVVVAAAVSGGFAQLCELLVEHHTAERRVDDSPVIELGAMPDPLPELGAADLGGGGVLHQIVEGHAAGAAQPGLDIADPTLRFCLTPASVIVPSGTARRSDAVTH